MIVLSYRFFYLKSYDCQLWPAARELRALRKFLTTVQKQRITSMLGVMGHELRNQDNLDY